MWLSEAYLTVHAKRKMKHYLIAAFSRAPLSLLENKMRLTLMSKRKYKQEMYKFKVF